MSHEPNHVFSIERPIEFMGRNVMDMIAAAVFAMLIYMFIWQPLKISAAISMPLTILLAVLITNVCTWYRENYPPMLVRHAVLWWKMGNHLLVLPDTENVPLIVSRELEALNAAAPTVGAQRAAAARKR